MKILRALKGFTLIELLVVISIIAVLASLAVPAVTGALVKGQLIQAVNNCHQIHIASMQMASDASTNSDSTMGWPGDIKTNHPSSGYAYLQLLVDNNYLNVGDRKVFAAAGVPAVTGSATLSGTNVAFGVYDVQDTDASTAIFLSSKNYKHGDTQSSFVTGTAAPFANKGIVICRKGGDTSVYKTVSSATTSYVLPANGGTPLALQ